MYGINELVAHCTFLEKKKEHNFGSFLQLKKFSVVKVLFIFIKVKTGKSSKTPFGVTVNRTPSPKFSIFLERCYAL